VEDLPRPPVTVHDPAGGPSADVLDSGPPRLSRRTTVVGAALVLVVALVAVGLQLRERRAAAAEARRLDAAVELSLLPDVSASSSTYPGSGSLAVQLEVRNDGPRAVEVAGAAWAGYALLRPVDVPSGGSRRIALQQEVDCGLGRPALLAVDDDVQLQVRTASTTRTVALPLPAPLVAPTEAERVCGFVPLEDALLAAVERQERVGDALVLRLDLSVAGSAPVDLLSVDAGPGLSAALRTGGGAEAVRLPTTLPFAEGGTFVPTTYEAVVTVTGCSAVGTPGEAALLTLTTGDQAGGTAQLLLSYEPPLLVDLVSASCPG
jgi:hypothetical protein